MLRVNKQVDKKGLPIGNLTSQIFANIYLNEFDQCVLHTLKPLSYNRYGDDFVLWFADEFSALEAQVIGEQFLRDELSLMLNPKHDNVQKCSQKLAYLGVDLWPNGKRLQPSVLKRIDTNLTLLNAASYHALIKQHQPKKYLKKLAYQILSNLD